VTDEAIEAHYAAELGAGQVPSRKAIRRRWSIGSVRADQIYIRLTARRLANLPAGEIPAAVSALPADDIREVLDILGAHGLADGTGLGPNADTAYQACTAALDKWFASPAELKASPWRRLPLLPVLVRTAEQRLTAARARLEAARQTPPGQTFTAGGQTLLRPVTPHGHSHRIWAIDPDADLSGGPTKGRRDLIFEEEQAFWAWATVEVLRHTGIRLEELLELSHHSFVQYRLPSTGEVVPLLQVAPSKTDQERLILVIPELADVLSAIVHRVREPGGAIPVIPSYDALERTWLPPMPLLFQRPVFTEHRRLSRHFIRDVLNNLVEAADLTDIEGRPLMYSPHDFRRLFVTDAVMNGLPPHIAQVICGHRDINTTMGYKAVYPQEAIEAHRLFIATRRAYRPSAEYRTPTDQEWDEFLAHFEKRKVSVGICARAYGTPCIHEHACVRCPMLRPDPAQLPRLLEIRDNLVDRIAEAGREGWLGEIEGLQVSLAGAKQKIAQAQASATPRTVQLGIPTHRASWAGDR
jgi:hypothetical protein